MNTEYKNEWFEILSEDGFYYLHEPKVNAGAAILVKEGDDFVFVKLFRRAVNKLVIEIPRGGNEIGEGSYKAAVRELEEETGYSINESQLILLGSVNPNSSFLTSSVDIFYVDVTGVKNTFKKNQEVQGLVRIKVNEIDRFILNGTIVDGFSLSAISFYKAKFS